VWYIVAERINRSSYFDLWVTKNIIANVTFPGGGALDLHKFSPGCYLFCSCKFKSAFSHGRSSKHLFGSCSFKSSCFPELLQGGQDSPKKDVLVN